MNKIILLLVTSLNMGTALAQEYLLPNNPSSNELRQALLTTFNADNINKSPSITTFGKTRSIQVPNQTRSIYQVNSVEEVAAIETKAEPKQKFSFAIPIQFEYNSAKLNPNSKQTLASLANVLKEPQLLKNSLVIAGHTDSVGSEIYNQTLGAKRSAAVRNYLIHLNIPSHRLIATSYGETQPFNENKPKSAENRRVEFINPANL